MERVFLGKGEDDAKNRDILCGFRWLDPLPEMPVQDADEDPERNDLKVFSGILPTVQTGISGGCRKL